MPASRLVAGRVPSPSYELGLGVNKHWGRLNVRQEQETHPYSGSRICVRCGIFKVQRADEEAKPE